VSPEGTGREDGGDDERVDPALADAVESAFDGVVQDEAFKRLVDSVIK